MNKFLNKVVVKMENTIAAISTAQAPGGIGIIRISGDNAALISDRVFKSLSGKKISDLKGYSALFGEAFDKNHNKIDDVVALNFKSPKSYTGENVVELSCHGGLYVTKKLLQAVIDAGAKPAEAGEFTKRAFLNGKIDLTQAEAVMQIISANGEESMKAAVAGESGVLSVRILEIRKTLTTISSHLAAWADFPDDDIPQVDEKMLKTNLELMKTELENLLKSFDKGKIIREGVTTAIIGRTNAGKSTLMNLFSGHDRSIVTEYEGTTRDIVEESVIVAGIPLILADTAGIRETDDPVEKIGVDSARKRIKSAQLIFAVFDASSELDDRDYQIIADTKSMRSIAIINKTDLDMKLDESIIHQNFENVAYISAKHGQGIEVIEQLLIKILDTKDFNPTEGTLYTERQRRDVSDALNSVTQALDAYNSHMTLDAVTVCVEDALSALYLLTGERVSDEVIGEVFENFCVGK